MGPHIYDIQEKCPILAPPLHPLFVCPNGSEQGETPLHSWTWKLRLPTTPPPLPSPFLAKNQNAKKKTKMLSQAQFPPEPDTCLSGTLIAEPDACLEHCLDSNNTYTNYSCGHPISVDPLPLPKPCCNHQLTMTSQFADMTSSSNFF